MGVYKRQLFLPFYDSRDYNKDHNLIKTEPILNIKDNDIFAGPKKLSSTKYILYIAKD
jgi:hypothetical protein